MGKQWPKNIHPINSTINRHQTKHTLPNTEYKLCTKHIDESTEGQAFISQDNGSFNYPNNCFGDGNSIRKHSSFISRFNILNMDRGLVMGSRFQIICGSCVWLDVGYTFEQYQFQPFDSAMVKIQILNFPLILRKCGTYLETLWPFIGFYI